MERRCGIGNKRQNPSRLAWKNMAVKKYHEQTVDKLANGNVCSRSKIALEKNWTVL